MEVIKAEARAGARARAGVFQDKLLTLAGLLVQVIY